MERIPDRKLWEAYMWEETLKDLPALLDFYNCLLFTRDLMLPKATNVHHALSITCMAVDGVKPPWDHKVSRQGGGGGGYREANSVQCVMRQLIVWHLFGHEISSWTNWIQCDDDPLSIQILKNSKLPSFDAVSVEVEQVLDDEVSEADLTLGPDERELNDSTYGSTSSTFCNYYPCKYVLCSSFFICFVS
jgi:hypothetical protein